jgi:hypothetical protein
MTVFGLAVGTTGIVLLSRLDEGASQRDGMAAMSVLGAGLGLSFPALVLATQNAVPHALAGVTTSLNQFARSVGGTIGVAIMGSILTRRLDGELARGLPEEVRAGAPAPLLGALHDPQVLLDNGALARLRDDGFGSVFGADGPRLFEATLQSMRSGLAVSITEVFIFASVLMGASMLISLLLREIPLRATYAAPEELPVSGAAGPGEEPPELRSRRSAH